jgi:hypothetical protein
MLKLKDGVTGFIYENIHGYVKKIFNDNLTEQEIKGINRVLGDDEVLVDNDNVNELFEIISKEGLENDVEGLNEVLEWVN